MLTTTSRQSRSFVSTSHDECFTDRPCRIKNPLAGLSYERLMHDADTFARVHGLEEHVGYIRKGAAIAQHPEHYEDLVGTEALNQEEITILRDEVLHKWRQPFALYVTIFTCSIGAAVQGWDQTGSNGANLSFPVEFGIGGTSDYDVFLVGLVNAAPYISSAFLGCWLSDPLNNLFGRKGTIFFSAVFCFLPVIGAAFTQNWWELFICRVLLGIGMGSKASTVPVGSIC